MWHRTVHRRIRKHITNTKCMTTLPYTLPQTIQPQECSREQCMISTRQSCAGATSATGQHRKMKHANLYHGTPLQGTYRIQDASLMRTVPTVPATCTYIEMCTNYAHMKRGHTYIYVYVCTFSGQLGLSQRQRGVYLPCAAAAHKRITHIGSHFQKVID